jgi:CheY-like chemotaxis protein
MFKAWNVLLVDDNADVLATSKLALKGLTCFGLPIKLFEAKSKAEAVAFLNDNPEAGALAVAFVDVVMESDRSGLELCDYIREMHKNPNVQLVVRTGQAGKAPEREVVDRYDISGYLAKVDATDQRLYSVLKTAIHQFATGTQAFRSLRALEALSAATGTRGRFLEALQEFMLDGNGAWIEGDTFVGNGTYKDQQATLKLRDSLRTAEGPKWERDRVVTKDGHYMLMLAATQNEPAVEVIEPHGGDVTQRPLSWLINAINYQRAVRSLWCVAKR